MLTGSGSLVRRYRANWSLRLFAVGFTAISATVLIHFLIAADGAPRVLNILGGTLFTLIGVALSIHFFTASVSVEVDVIEVRSVFKKRRLSLSEICRQHALETNDSEGGKHLFIVLEPCDRSLPDMKIERMYNFDLDFEVWLGQIPSLEQ